MAVGCLTPFHPVRVEHIVLVPDVAEDARAALHFQVARLASHCGKVGDAIGPQAPNRPEELTDPLPHIQVPALLYVGTENGPEPIDWAASLMTHAPSVALEGLSQPQAFRRSDLVLPHVRGFLDRIPETDPGS